MSNYCRALRKRCRQSPCRGGCRSSFRPPLTVSFPFLFNALCTGHIQWGQAMPLVNYGDVNMTVPVAYDDVGDTVAWTGTLLAALAHKYVRPTSIMALLRPLLPGVHLCFCCTAATALFATPILLPHLYFCRTSPSAAPLLLPHLLVAPPSVLRRHSPHHAHTTVTTTTLPLHHHYTTTTRHTSHHVHTTTAHHCAAAHAPRSPCQQYLLHHHIDILALVYIIHAIYII